MKTYATRSGIALLLLLGIIAVHVATFRKATPGWGVVELVSGITATFCATVIAYIVGTTIGLCEFMRRRKGKGPFHWLPAFFRVEE